MYYQLIFTLSIVIAINNNHNMVNAVDPPVPIWPSIFQEEFNETSIVPNIGTGTLKGVYYYDYEHRAGRMDRTTGKYDHFCGPVMEFADIPCTHLVVDGFRYLIFPTIQNCCMCCTVEQGCGILRPDWLMNATFIGYNTSESITYQVWDKKGFSDNYYWQVDGTQIPYMIDEPPHHKTVFNVSSFSKTIDPSVFAVPSYCSKANKCSSGSVCNF